MNNGKRHKSIQPMGNILCKKNNDIILKNILMKYLGNSFNLLNESVILNNQHISQSNTHIYIYIYIYITCDLVFLVILLEKEHSSSRWYIKCKSPSNHWKLFNHSIGDE